MNVCLICTSSNTQEAISTSKLVLHTCLRHRRRQIRIDQTWISHMKIWSSCMPEAPEAATQKTPYTKTSTPPKACPSEIKCMLNLKFDLHACEGHMRQRLKTSFKHRNFHSQGSLCLMHAWGTGGSNFPLDSLGLGSPKVAILWHLRSWHHLPLQSPSSKSVMPVHQQASDNVAYQQASDNVASDKNPCKVDVANEIQDSGAKTETARSDFENELSRSNVGKSIQSLQEARKGRDLSL